MKKLLAFWKTFSWVVLMLVLFLIPSQTIPGSKEIPHLDKVAHVLLFMVFTMCFIRDRLKASDLKTIIPGYILTTLLVVLFFAAMVELLQIIMHAGREGDIVDIYYDFAGFTLGLFIMIVVYGVRSRSL